jgi:hypothetical protein
MSEAQARMEESMGGMKVKGLRRLRLGELLALIGAICVIVSLTQPWYGGATPGGGASASGELSAWATFGPTIVLLMLCTLIALLLVGATIFERSPALPVAAAVWSTFFGFIAVVAAIVRLLERPHEAGSVRLGAWLAFAGALAILAGGWQSLRDERTEIYESPEPQRREIE